MSIPTYSPAGVKKAGAAKLPPAPEVGSTAVVEAIQAVLANERRERPLTKTRAAVRGGGSKPWRQKGTGRARAGSNRSPLWRGGGTTFGPSGQSRPYKKINRKLRRAVWLHILNDRAAANKLRVLSGKLALERTKEAARLLAKLDAADSALVVVADRELGSTIGVRNLAGVDLTSVSDLTIVDLLRTQQVVISEAALQALTGQAQPTAKAASRKPGTKPTPARKSSAKTASTKKETK